MLFVPCKTSMDIKVMTTIMSIRENERYHRSGKSIGRVRAGLGSVAEIY